MDNLYTWIRPLLNKKEWDILMNFTKQDKFGRFILRRTVKARKKYRLSLRQVTKIVKRLELYAQWYEIYILLTDEDL